MRIEKMEAAIADMERRMDELAHALDLFKHELEIEKQNARTWNGPNLDTKEGN